MAKKSKSKDCPTCHRWLKTVKKAHDRYDNLGWRHDPSKASAVAEIMSAMGYTLTTEPHTISHVAGSQLAPVIYHDETE